MPSLFVKLPCKPVVKQYLVNKYGEACNFPEGDWLKKLIEGYLEKNIAEQDTKITLQYYTETMQVPLTYKLYELHGDTLSKTSIRAINNRIEDVIHQRLFQHLEFYVHIAKYELKDAILMFQELYCFPEDVYTGAAISKYYQRKIKPYLNLEKFASVNVLPKKPKQKKRLPRENVML